MKSRTDMKTAFYLFINRWKYEFLLFTLITHLYMGIFLTNIELYTKVLWPLNMILIGIASIGVFSEKTKREKSLKNALLTFVIILPFSIPLLREHSLYMVYLSAIYVLFFIVIFITIIKFLIRPCYINTDIISASACGLFLLIEICVFTLQAFYYFDPTSIGNIDASNPATIYMDLVYYSSITATTIGFGDITAVSHSTKLFSSFFGVVCQFYSVVLVGILISKFVNDEGMEDIH